MLNIQNELGKLGYQAKHSSYDNPGIMIYNKDTNETVIELTVTELAKTKTSEETWALIQSKLNAR